MESGSQPAPATLKERQTTSVPSSTGVPSRAQKRRCPSRHSSGEAVDEVVNAAEGWREGAEAMRAAGYRHVPRRPARREVPREAIDAVLASPHVVLRARFGSGEPWKPGVPGPGTG
ncbi:hypothetical protein [Streptomyces sp. ST2-7A]|uniref:hypothetical protein n=1 Tax=Streptomyces sp. ST2-7A TaxID=2907214 RepID=UPI001F16F6D4|nr:hypothetical protein [Streptomyces sp. ST2-7A]MCE7082078.1 hypothetical protein [Streptomyces sp. ST2-7A]